MASRGVNKVILVGNLGKDPEVKYTNSGSAICNLTIATSESWRDKSTGEQKERTEWHRVVIFGKLAEIAGEHLRKGSQIYVEGQLQTRKWQDQSTGQDRYSTEVVITQMGGVLQMLGGRPEGGQQQPRQQQQQQGGWGQPQQPTHSGTQQAKQQLQRPAQQPGGNEPPMDFEDDIPF